MSTFTNTPKNTVSLTNIVKNVATFKNQVLSHTLAYITTDTPDYVLLGASEDEVLIWDTPTIYKNLAKS